VEDLGFVTPCFVWVGQLDRDSYGVVRFEDQMQRVHRLMYKRSFFLEPDMTIDHLCHTHTDCRAGLDCRHRACVRVCHMEPVSLSENRLRGRRW
jgi:hypothetical protein